MSLQQQEITEEIIAMPEFLLDESILFRQQWVRGALIAARDIGRREEMRKGGDLLAPGQVLQHAVQKGDADGNGDGGEGRRVGAQTHQPAQNVRIALQLLQSGNRRVVSS